MTKEKAQKYCKKVGHEYLCPDVLISAIINSGSLSMFTLFQSLGINLKELQMIVAIHLSQKETAPREVTVTTKIFELAKKIAASYDKELGEHSPEFVLLAMTDLMDHEQPYLYQFLNEEFEGFTDKLAENLEAFIEDRPIEGFSFFKDYGETTERVVKDGESQEPFEQNKILEEFATNLNVKASNGEFDGLVDYDNTLERLYTTLCRERKKNVIITGIAGVGKCLSPSEKVIMFDGSLKEAQHIQKGDLLMGPDSKPRTVLGLGDGEDEMYRVHQVNGESYEVNSEHILSLRQSYPKDKAGTIVNVPIKEYLSWSDSKKQQFKGWKAPVSFLPKKTLTDPYFIGLWLGDGTTGKPEITTYDSEVIDYLVTFAQYNQLDYDYKEESGKFSLSRRVDAYVWRHDDDGFIDAEFESYLEAAEDLSLARKDVYSVARNISTACQENRKAYGFYWSSEKQTPAKDFLKREGILEDKFIPKSYKINCPHVQKQVLAGLLDSDGYYSETSNCFEITLVNKRLLEDLVFVARSLGLRVNQTEKRVKMKREDGTIYETNGYRALISGDVDIIPTRIARKQARKRKQIKNPLNTGIEIESIGRGKYYGFTIDGDRLFLLKDFTVTHNTSLVELLARNIVEGTAPDLLKDKVIYDVHLSEMVSGAIWRGQFEQRLTRFVEEAKKRKNVILFFDEIHTLVGAGGAGRGDDLEASNILKPALARGELSCIGATTPTEFDSKIKGDAALERRFQQVRMYPPNSTQMKDILPHVVNHYESLHPVEYTDEFISRVIPFCDKELPNKSYPDKLSDVIDFCGARAKMDFFTTPDDVKAFEEEVLSSSEDVNDEDFRAKISRLGEMYEKWNEELVDAKAPVEVSHLEFYLKENIFNLLSPPLHKEFVERLGDRVINKKNVEEFGVALHSADFKTDNHPPIILVYGEKKVGKTYFLDAVGDCLRNCGCEVIRVTKFRLTPDYILADKRSLAKKLSHHENPVVILDDCDLISSDAANILSDALQTGWLEATDGERVDISNVTFIMSSGVSSSNIGFEGSGAKPNISKDIEELSQLVELKPPTNDHKERYLEEKVKGLRDNLKKKGIDMKNWMGCQSLIGDMNGGYDDINLKFRKKILPLAISAVEKQEKEVDLLKR